MTFRLIPTPQDLLAAYLAPITARIEAASKGHKARAELQQAKTEALHQVPRSGQ